MLLFETSVTKSWFEFAQICVILVLMVGCTQIRDFQNPPESKAAVAVAFQYIKENFPTQSHVLGYEARVFDRGENWAITFRVPGRIVTGGFPEFYINKKSLVVVHVAWAQ